jgi:hypothetical protein
LGRGVVTRIAHPCDVVATRGVRYMAGESASPANPRRHGPMTTHPDDGYYLEGSRLRWSSAS